LFFRKQEIKQSKSINFSAISKELLSKLSPSLQKAVSLAQEKDASSWLTALPVQEHGFSLHKTAFHDALALASYLLVYLLTVLVELVFQLTIPFYVQNVAFPLSAIMK